MSAVNTNVKEISPTRKSITIYFTSEEIVEEEAQLVRDFQGQAKVPGFRPGKAPEKMVRTRFAKDIANELKTRIVSKAHKAGVSGSELNIYGIVELDEGQIAVGREASVTFTVDIIPEFELPVYEGLNVTNTPTKASGEEVDKAFNKMLSQRAEYNIVEKAAEKGDYVRCGYEGKIGDELVADLVPDAPIYGTQKTTWEEAGSEDSPGVRAIIDGIVGMQAGDEKEVTMKFSQEFRPQALAGKSAIYSIKVEEVREKLMPELNDEFFKSIQVKNEEELRQQIGENIENQKKQQNFQSERQQITDKLLKAIEFPLPKSGIEGETDSILRDFMQKNMQRGVTRKDFEKQKETLYEGATKAAADRLKSRIILSKISEKEKIKVENEDFSRIIMNEAMQAGQKPDKWVKELRKDQDRINRMRMDILLSKTMDLLVEKAERKIVEVEVSESE